MDSERTTLGEYLRAARNAKNLTLRDVEQDTEISNAYLSQLESGKIKRPSPEVLSKLSEAYDISYTDLLSLAGHPIPKGHSAPPTYAHRIGPITDEEESKLLEYLQFLRSRKG